MTEVSDISGRVPRQPSIKLEIVAPTRRVFSGDVESVTIPAAKGSMGVLPGHAPFLGLLTAGAVKARPLSGQTAGRSTPVTGRQASGVNPAPFFFPISGGIAEVLHDSVIILADSPDPAS